MDTGTTTAGNIGRQHCRLLVNLVRLVRSFTRVYADLFRTNKKFKSTIHRVTNLTGQERYSIPFFFGVDYDTTVSVLPNHISDDRPSCKEPFKAGEVSNRIDLVPV